MRQLIVPVLCGLIGSPANAHHSTAIFDGDSDIVVEGVVSGYDWKYPHVYIFVDAEDNSGRWQIEGDNPRAMSQAGWTETTLAIGDQVRIRGNPHRRTELRHALMVSLTTPDDVTLTPELLDAPEPTVVAADIFSIWAAPPFDRRRLNAGSPTEKGAAARAAFTEEADTQMLCEPPSPPLTFGIGLTEISSRGEHVLIRTEEWEIERIVYMDGRESPANGERTLHGYSVGRWEGDVLVIETGLFSDNIDGSLFDTPSGAQKRLVERLQLTEDGTQLSVAFVLEDPEYLQQPATGEYIMDHVPNQTIMPAPCDLESARRWMGE